MELQRRLAGAEIDLLLLTDPDSIYYVSAYWGDLGVEFGRPSILAVPRAGDLTLITPLMESEMAGAMTWVSDIRTYVDGIGGEWTDPLGDMLTRIRNGQRAGLPVVRSPASKFRSSVLEVLTKEGYIRGYSQQEVTPGKPEITIELKYYEGEPVIRSIRRVSKPGRRVYSHIKDLPTVSNGLGVAILSTPKGVMSDSEARAVNVGGEVLCNVI